MRVARSTGSQASVRRSNPSGEASCGEHASRSESDTRFGLVTLMGAARLPRMRKPATDGEVTGVSTQRAPRGDWGQRAWIDRSRYLGGPARREPP